MGNNVFSVDFDSLENHLDTVYFNNEKAMEIINDAGFTDGQVKLINILIVSALKSYDLLKQK